MSTHGLFNSKSPTIKRIMKEASELSSNPSSDFHAAPLDTNLFEWHFTLRGAPSPSPYANGAFHGRIILPPTYPLRPPSFRFVTPTGRFEVNREICLSISGHHEETWQPAWGIRTALVAIRSFMDTDAKGQVGGLECSADARRKMAEESREWKCGVCGRSNEEILKESATEAGEGERKEEVVPEELRLTYREDLGAEKKDTPVQEPCAGAAPSDAAATSTKGKERAPDAPAAATSSSQPTLTPTPTIRLPPTTAPPTMVQAPRPPETVRQALHQQVGANTVEGVPAWVDKALFGLIGALLYMVARKFLM